MHVQNIFIEHRRTHLRLQYLKCMYVCMYGPRRSGNSIGGVVEVVARNVPSGLGAPVFDKLEAELAKACMSLPASKGFEVGR